MRVTAHPMERALGGTGLPDRLVFSERERATLRAASAILAKARDRLDDDTDTDVALAMYTCEELAQAGMVNLPTR